MSYFCTDSAMLWVRALALDVLDLGLESQSGKPPKLFSKCTVKPVLRGHDPWDKEKVVL